MSSPASTVSADYGAAPAAAHYVYGIVAADAALPRMRGIGDAPIGLVSRGALGAVISSLPDGAAPLGTRADLLSHDGVVTALVEAGVTVLPMRFGAVLAGPDAVARQQELLAAHQDVLGPALERIRDRVQFTVRARYDQESALRAVIARNPQIVMLREAAREHGGRGYGDQIRLGELVVAGLGVLRNCDAPLLLAQLEQVAEGTRTREPAEPLDLLDAAFLVPVADSDAFVRTAEQLAARVNARIRIRGPQACYDFVPET